MGEERESGERDGDGDVDEGGGGTLLRSRDSQLQVTGRVAELVSLLPHSSSSSSCISLVQVCWSRGMRGGWGRWWKTETPSADRRAVNGGEGGGGEGLG